MFGVLNKKSLKIFAVLGVLVLLLAFFIYRVGGISTDRVDDTGIPLAASGNTIHFSDAPKNIGENLWVWGTVDHVFVSVNNNHFINFCSDFRDCPFSSVIFSENAFKFDDVESWTGSMVYIYGNISTYEGRPQIVIERTEQVAVEDRGVSEVIDREGVFEVVNVMDGDTVWVIVDGVTESVRMIGIDAPETEGPYSDEECFGPEAKDRLSELLYEGFVILKTDPAVSDRDRYGRLLRYIYLPDGRSVNGQMVKEGYASVYEVEPFGKLDKFLSLEEKARLEGSGMWGGCDHLLE